MRPRTKEKVMSKAWSWRTLAAGAAVLALSGAALAQYGHPKAKPPAGKKDDAPPILDRVKPHDWTLTAYVNVRIDQTGRDSNGMPLTTGFRFDTASVIFPM